MRSPCGLPVPGGLPRTPWPLYSYSETCLFIPRSSFGDSPQPPVWRAFLYEHPLSKLTASSQRTYRVSFLPPCVV